MLKRVSPETDDTFCHCHLLFRVLPDPSRGGAWPQGWIAFYETSTRAVIHAYEIRTFGGGGICFQDTERPTEAGAIGSCFGLVICRVH